MVPTSPDYQNQILRVLADHRNKRIFERLVPIGMNKKSRERVGEIDQREYDQNFFNWLVRPAHHHNPHQQRTQRHANVFADMKNAHA